MATDLESATESGKIAIPRPGLKIIRLCIRGLKSIGSLDLPGDGLGWDGPIPDMVMVGGVNGSGKTALLEFLVSAFEHMEVHDPARTIVDVSSALRVTEAIIDFEFSAAVYGMDAIPVQFIIGDDNFIQTHKNKNWFGIQDIGAEAMRKAFDVGGQTEMLGLFHNYIKPKARDRDHDCIPAVVYFPAERRTFISPPTKYKSAGGLTEGRRFVDRWEPPERWDDSLEAKLYAVRWADLNAKEAGQPEAASRFRSYQLAFDRFFEGRKRIKWTHRGELVVETNAGVVHDLTELSSGEKQVILFIGELLHRWRPGSLILIDEPELHLHESYQTRLWESLVDWQKERGGQVIVATQSGHLFRLADSAMKVLLSRRSR